MNIIKTILCITVCFLICIPEAGAQKGRGEKVSVANLAVSRDKDQLFISMDINVSSADVESNRELLLTPWISGKQDSLALQPILVAGRFRYYHHLRDGHLSDDMPLYRYGKVKTVEYRQSLRYEPWMNGAELKLGKETCGCFSKTLAEDAVSLYSFKFEPKVFVPQFVYLKPEATVHKISVAGGTAYIDFPVNKTELYEDYRRNPAELAKIRATIDAIRNDADTRILSVTIKGYASPEGSYTNNERLAKGRTETLRRYVQGIYAFPDTLLATDCEPEDWAGLERYVQGSQLQHREAILDIIRGGLAPDAKEWKIKSSYPKDYAFLLKEVYPGLRHSDYAVKYEVRAYVDVDEIRRVMKTAPQKLSLQELFLVAQHTPAGSDDYNEAFEIAVRMFPDDATANLNAANIAMSKGDLTAAQRYLAKAGNAPEAVYARGVHAALSGNYEQAELCFGEAGQRGIAEAEEALRRIAECKEWQAQ